MNSCGVNIPYILEKFIDINDVEDVIQDYYFSEWYDYFKDVTIPSYIYEYDDLFNGKISKKIKEMGCCFARLDTCSTKPTEPYYNVEEIIYSFRKSDRTCREFNKDMKIILRNWVDIGKEFRCFIHNKELRAISGYCDRKNIPILQEILSKFDYLDYTADFSFIDNKITLIEINTPVYLCATSGFFDLTIPYDYEILLGEKRDIILYPVIRLS